MCSAKGHVRFTPKSGHVQCTSACPLCANSGHSRVPLSLKKPGTLAGIFLSSHFRNGSPEDQFPRRPVKSVIDATANNVAENLVDASINAPGNVGSIML